MRRALELQDGQSGESLPPPAATAAATSASVTSVASVDALTLPFKEAREAWNDEFERAYVRKLLERHSGNVAEAAEAAGVDRTYVYRLIRKHRV